MSIQPSEMLRARGILTRKQLATEIGIAEQTVNDWKKKGMPTLQQGMTILYDIDEVLDWMRSNRGKKTTRRAA